MFRRVDVEHDVIGALLVRESDLRKVSEAQLVELILNHAGPIMDETDALNVELGIEVKVRVTLEGA